MTTNKKPITDKLSLTVSTRKVFGKKLKALRKQGVIAANVFGQDFKSQAVSVNFKDFIKTYKVAKETGLVYLQLEQKEIPVLIQHLQHHPVTDHILHVDFRKVDLTKKIETEVPIKITGTSEAVTQKGGVLLTQSNALKVEARPEDLPSQIEIDISGLKDLNQEIKVNTLPKNTKYVINEPADKIIVSVVEHKEEAVIPETTTVAPEIITEKEEAQPEAETPKEPTKQPKETPQEKSKESPAKAKKPA